MLLTKSQLVKLDIPSDAQVLPGTKPSIIRVLPSFWAAWPRALAVSDRRVWIVAVPPMVDPTVLAESTTAEVCVRQRLFGRQLRVDLDEASIAIDGLTDVTRTRALLD